MDFESVKYTERLKNIFKSIFTKEFMCKNTNFEDFKSFQYSSAVFVNWNAEELVYDTDNLDNFVRESTKFSSWDKMVRSAVDEKIQSI